MSLFRMLKGYEDYESGEGRESKWENREECGAHQEMQVTRTKIVHG